MARSNLLQLVRSQTHWETRECEMLTYIGRTFSNPLSEWLPCEYIHISIHSYIRANIHTQAQACMSTYVHEHSGTYKNSWTHISIHTFIYTYTQLHQRRSKFTANATSRTQKGDYLMSYVVFQMTGFVVKCFVVVCFLISGNQHASLIPNFLGIINILHYLFICTYPYVQVQDWCCI